MPPKRGLGSKRGSIQFVNAWPLSESERLELENSVRAHVGEWNSRQLQEEDSPRDQDVLPPSEGASDARALIAELEQYDSSSSRSSSQQLSPPSQSTPSIQLSDKFAEFGPLRMRAMVYASQQYHNNSMDYSLSPISWATDWFDRNRRPIEYIGRLGSSLDPFAITSYNRCPDAMQFGRHYILSVLWPMTIACSTEPTTSTANATLSSWLSLFLADKMMRSAFMYDTLSHWRAQHLDSGGTNDPVVTRTHRLQRVLESETILLVEEAIKDPARATSDSVIFAVLCLTYVSTESNPRYYKKNPFQVPLQSLQWINIYGAHRPNPIHKKGLFQLLQMRGGLNNIDLPCLGSTLSFGDIINASVWLSRPSFPYESLERTRNGLPLQALLGFNSEDVNESYGQIRAAGFTEEMADVFQAMYVYMGIVRDYLDGALLQADLSLICDQRNKLQHSILSLPPVCELSGVHQLPCQVITYEACRLGAMIYGVGIIFPIPAQNSPLTQLACLLQAVLEDSYSTGAWEFSHPRILLFWLLTLGGIAAESSPERVWYVNKLGEAAKYNNFCCWPDLRNTVGLMPWYGPACDKAARVLWSEVELACDIRPQAGPRCCADTTSW